MFIEFKQDLPYDLARIKINGFSLLGLAQPDFIGMLVSMPLKTLYSREQYYRVSDVMFLNGEISEEVMSCIAVASGSLHDLHLSVASTFHMVTK